MALRFALWLRILSLLGGLQLVLGVWLALYGRFPSTTNVLRVAMSTGDPVLTAHMALAVLLLIVAFVVVVAAFSGEAPPRLRWVALAGLVALFGAYLAGILLIESGFSSSADSAGMLLAWLVAMACFGLGQSRRVLSASPPPPPPTTEVVAGPAS